jgi:hypothetical protein
MSEFGLSDEEQASHSDELLEKCWILFKERLHEEVSENTMLLRMKARLVAESCLQSFASIR